MGNNDVTIENAVTGGSGERSGPETPDWRSDSVSQSDNNDFTIDFNKIKDEILSTKEIYKQCDFFYDQFKDEMEMNEDETKKYIRDMNEVKKNQKKKELLLKLFELEIKKTPEELQKELFNKFKNNINELMVPEDIDNQYDDFDKSIDKILELINQDTR